MHQGFTSIAPARFGALADEEIVNHAREGNTVAAEYLLSKYRSLVEGKARGYFLAGADRDDVVQEGMIGLFKAIRDFRTDRPAGFRAFAELCVTRQIITAVKSATRQKHTLLNKCVSLYGVGGEDSSSSLVDVLPDTHVVDPEKNIVDAGSRLEVRAQDGLSGLEQRVLECYVQGMTYREIAAAISCSPKSIDNALQRAKHKIGKRIAKD
jgi:RNA polymerase sporulation-specific sigma factor